ncbi:YfjI family protein [Larkinella ripae]
MRPEMIPEPLRDWLTDIANRMKCPPDYVAAAAIVMISSLVGTRLTIKPKTKDDWTVIPNLWGAVIGDPSSMKTPSVAEVFKPLDRLIKTEEKKYKELLQQYEADHLTFDAQKKVYQSQQVQRLKNKNVDNPVSYPQEPAKPVERRFMTNDSTIEKMADLLNENPAGMLQYRDELMGLLSGWDRAGREQDRAFFLEGWNGSGSTIVDRIGRGTLHVDNVCISLFGGIQPAKLLSYLQGAQGHENDGLVQRLQLAVYPDKADWAYTDEWPDKAARDQAFTLIQRIADSDFLDIAYQADDYNRFRYTRFDEEAQEVFKQWLIRWETQVLPNETGLLLEHFTKYRSLVPSLALIFHVANCEANPNNGSGKKRLVSKEAISQALLWCDYLQTHARRIYGLLETVDVVAGKELLRHLKKGDLETGFKVREVTKKGWSNLNTADLVDSAVSELIELGWLLEVKPQPSQGGRPEASHYLIHPKILSERVR